MIFGRHGNGGARVTKVIKVQDHNYRLLLEILHELEEQKNERLSFDDAISLLMEERKARLKKAKR